MPSPVPGTLHPYAPNLVAFEHASTSNASSATPTNTLLWIGGLGDGLLGVRYVSTIASQLPTTWSVAEVLTSSSYKGWATGSLERDVKQIAKCVEYFKKARGGKVVIMGHSTGSQDVLTYITSEGRDARPSVEGAILQASVSDREGVVEDIGQEAYEEICADAKAMVERGQGEEVMKRNKLSKMFGAMVTASRTLSLLSPEKNGADDLFSSDLDDTQLAKTFGNLPKETVLLILMSDEDEHVPASVDKRKLVERWTKIVKESGGKIDEGNGGLVGGATHNLNGSSEEVKRGLAERVVRFLDGLEGRVASKV